MATFVLEMDVDRDGDPEEDITAYVTSGFCFRGKEDGSNLKGVSIAGALQAELLNLDAAWSRFNTSSPFYGSRLPGARIRLRSTAPTAAVLWTGFIDHIDPKVRNAGLPRATLYAYGVFAKFSGEQAKIRPIALNEVLTSDVVDTILDTAGHPAGDRDIDTGTVPVGRWYPDEREAIGLLHEMEEQEGGELFEDLDWGVAFRNRYDRLLNHATSVATFTDDGAGPLGYRDIEQSDPAKNVFNKFEGTITPHTVLASQQVWSLSDGPITLAPGESRTYFVQMPTNIDGATVAYVEEWTWLNISRDGNVTNGFLVGSGVVEDLGDVEVTATPFATTCKVVIENIDAGSHTVDVLLLDAVLVLAVNPYKVEDQDQDSIDDFGPRLFPFTSPWFPNSAYALASMAWEKARHKDEHPIITKTIVANNDTLFAQAVTRDLGDRITLESESAQSQLGINQDFHIESRAFVFGAKQFLRATWTLSPVVDVYGGADPFILDSSLLDGSDVLVY